MSGVNFGKMIEVEEGLLAAAGTGFIAQNRASNYHVRPKLVYNNAEQGQTVLSALEEELSDCDAFWFTVAFITDNGLNALKLPLKESAERGVSGRILTSNYLQFNSPKALRELLKLKNVEVRVHKEQLHIKGYYFSYSQYSNMLIGSANLTSGALLKNQEWNLRISSLDNGAVLQETQAEFERLWQEAEPLTEAWIQTYEQIYQDIQRVLGKTKLARLDTATLQPNKMQQEALASLDAIRKEGAKKALIISATGTGKTYLSAFDVRSYQPKKVLFVAHREQLLKQAKASYERVMSNSITTGLYGGQKRDKEVDYLFATVQTLSKEEHLHQFSPEAFDYIIVDEVHRAGASSYMKILEYFQPKFWLGMTATPERSDGFDIYKLFDYQIAYEIRLQRALEEDLLCPFHYYGISDIIVDGTGLEEHADFQWLAREERVHHILEQATYYGYSGDRVKGLAFCSTIQEAELLAAAFSKRGVPSIALTGRHTQEEREKAIERLQQDAKEGSLSYIFTVDIFNEGVDIPSVNQILMLRPTESAIIFVQQLGRGLRKAVHKTYVNVLDFIGNYEKNYLIPIALSGDHSYNKDNVRRYMARGARFIPGVSTIHFEKIIRDRIYQSIEKSKWNSIAQLKKEYQELKVKLGRIPTIMDFQRLGTMDIQNYFTNSSCWYLAKNCSSYYGFLVKYEPEYTERLTRAEEEMLSFVCMKLSRGKRKEELAVLYRLLTDETVELAGNPRMLRTVERVLTNLFVTSKNAAKQFSQAIFVDTIKRADTSYQFKKTATFEEALKNPVFYRMFKEVLEYGLGQYEQHYQNHYADTNFVLYKKYTYEEVCAHLHWNTNIVALNIGGYRYDKETNTFPVFINYHKSKDIPLSIQYEDRFLDDSHLIALSKSKRTFTSPEIQTLSRQSENGVKVYLFVRKGLTKKEKDTKEFYFLGYMHVMPNDLKQVQLASGEDAVEIHYALDKAIPPSLYEYITVENIEG